MFTDAFQVANGDIPHSIQLPLAAYVSNECSTFNIYSNQDPEDPVSQFKFLSTRSTPQRCHSTGPFLNTIGIFCPLNHRSSSYS
jgi:hypothetical protein